MAEKTSSLKDLKKNSNQNQGRQMMTRQGEVVNGMKEILEEDLIVFSKTHENPPPGKDCEEECGVDIHDLIAAANPICSPMRSGGKKHRRCMDCWNEYIDNLIVRLLTKQASQDVVIKVDKKTNGNLVNNLWDAMQSVDLDECRLLVKQALEGAGYSAWESLIKEEKMK